MCAEASRSAPDPSPPALSRSAGEGARSAPRRHCGTRNHWRTCQGLPGASAGRSRTLVIRMTTERPQRLRVTYRKAGALRYVGHLDLMRTWERALRRARLPLAYTQGFLAPCSARARRAARGRVRRRAGATRRVDVAACRTARRRRAVARGAAGRPLGRRRRGGAARGALAAVRDHVGDVRAGLRSRRHRRRGAAVACRRATGDARTGVGGAARAEDARL